MAITTIVGSNPQDAKLLEAFHEMMEQKGKAVGTPQWIDSDVLNNSV